MSKQRTIKKRKRRTGFINLTKPQPFKYKFSSFAELANHVRSK